MIRDILKDIALSFMAIIIIGGGLVLLTTTRNMGEQIYTGYIYSATRSWGVMKGHIRFSETAGEDTQPSFCVDKDSEEMLQDLAGSSKKVRVKVPAGFKIAIPWRCSFPATIELIEVEQ